MLNGGGGGGRSAGGGAYRGGGGGQSSGRFAFIQPTPSVPREPKIQASPPLQVRPQRGGGGGGMNDVQRAAMSAAMRYLTKINPHLISSL